MKYTALIIKMRRHYSQIDSKTGNEILLSEVSYNEACCWLAGTLEAYGYEVRNTAVTTKPFPLTVITTNSIKVGALGRTFFYDEERGYLLGE